MDIFVGLIFQPTTAFQQGHHQQDFGDNGAFLDGSLSAQLIRKALTWLNSTSTYTTQPCSHDRYSGLLISVKSCYGWIEQYLVAISHDEQLRTCLIEDNHILRGHFTFGRDGPRPCQDPLSGFSVRLLTRRSTPYLTSVTPQRHARFGFLEL